MNIKLSWLLKNVLKKKIEKQRPERIDRLLTVG